MKMKIRTIVSGLSFRIIGAFILILILFGIISGMIGYMRFTTSITESYKEAAFRTADTAVMYVNGDHLEEYLESGGKGEEYENALTGLNVLCQKQNVTLIYVIAVDVTDYNHFLSVFNTVNENSGYTPWEVGYERETTNEEYRQIYIDIYEHGLERGTIVRTNNLHGLEAHITSLIPVKGSDGSVKGILCVQRPMSELVRGRNQYLHQVFFMTAVLAILVIFFATVYLRKRFISPLQMVSKETERFAKESSLSDDGIEMIPDNIREIKILTDSIHKMESDTVTHMREITHITAEKERMETELSVAAQIQSSMVPKDFDAYSGYKEFELYASMTPAKEVGGDFYDFFLVDDAHLALVMADVSGKGVPAALFMAKAKTSIKTRAMMGGTPAEILADVNEQMCEGNEAELFVTVWLAVIDIATGKGMAANAGHEHPTLRKEDGSFELIKYRHSPAVAIMEGMRFREHEFMLEKGDALFVYTDGVTEATDVKDELFGEERLLHALNRKAYVKPEEFLFGVKEDIDAFVKEAPQFDDITMLGFIYHGRDE